MARYRFRFDAKGMELGHVELAPGGAPAQPEAIEPPPIAAPVPSEVVEREAFTGPAAAAVTASTLEPATIINELREWLEEHASFGLDMDVLEEREVLITPPHWRYVSQGVGPLSGKEVADPLSREDQRQAMRKYARMLGERQPVIDQALKLAAFASVASTSNDPAKQLQDALKALPKGGRMDISSIAHLNASPDLPMLMTGAVALLLREGKAREWAETVRRIHDAIVRSTPEPTWADIEDASWSTWKERFQQYRRGRRSFDVDVNDLLLRTRWAGPAALFRNELGRMPLQKWTEALVIAVRRTQEQSVLEIPDWVRGEVEKELVSGRKTLLVILGESVTSPTAQWLPSKQNGCLWIERTRWFEYYDALRLGETDSFGATLWYVAVEVSGDPDTLARVVRQDVATAAFGSPPAVPQARELRLAYLGKEKLPTQVIPLVPYVENAKGVDEAISKLELLTRARSSAQS